MIIPQKVSVILCNKNAGYYTSLINNKHYLYSFKNREIAKSCTSFLAEYKHRYNTFPPVDNQFYNPTIVEINKRKSINEILNNEISVVTENTNDLLSLCGTTNMDLLILDNFEYSIRLNNIDIEFSAINIQPDYIDFSNKVNIEYLTSLLDI